MIIGKDESKTLTKHISISRKFNGRKCNSNEKWDNDKCGCDCENPIKNMDAKKVIFEILVNSEIDHYSKNIISDLVVT